MAPQKEYSPPINGMHSPQTHVMIWNINKASGACLCSYPPKKKLLNPEANIPPIGPAMLTIV